MKENKTKAKVEGEERTKGETKMSKTKGTGKREQGTGENNTFNNPLLVLMNLCYATTSVWNVYDSISVMASKNRLILTRKERNAISKISSALLECYVELEDLMSKRLSGVVETKEGGAK